MTFTKIGDVAQTLTLRTDRNGRNVHMCPGPGCGMCVYFGIDQRENTAKGLDSTGECEKIEEVGNRDAANVTAPDPVDSR